MKTPVGGAATVGTAAAAGAATASGAWRQGDTDNQSLLEHQLGRWEDKSTSEANLSTEDNFPEYYCVENKSIETLSLLLLVPIPPFLVSRGHFLPFLPQRFPTPRLRSQ